jgi:hypothetical protein
MCYRKFAARKSGREPPLGRRQHLYCRKRPGQVLIARMTIFLAHLLFAMVVLCCPLLQRVFGALVLLARIALAAS